jgi:hypothetical protein
LASALGILRVPKYGEALAWTIAALVIASLVIAAGTVAAIASWLAALRNTSRLEDKTWFAVVGRQNLSRAQAARS